MSERSPKPEEENVDQVLEAIGVWGEWQSKMFYLLGVVIIPGCFQILNLTFVNASQDFWCAPPDNLTITDTDEWLLMSGQTNLSQRCSIFDLDYATVSDPNWHLTADPLPPRRPCTAWEYDTNVFKTSVISDWDLVCDNAHLGSFAQTTFFAGMLVGVFISGILSDKYGRKKVIIPLLMSMSVVGILSAHMPTFASFVVLRAVCAMLFIGILECAFTWVLESCGGKWTTIVGIGIEFFWVAGWLILALLAYLIRDWRMLLTILSLPGLFGFLLIWFLPESPKWLLSVGRIPEAEAIIRKAAKKNLIFLPLGWRLKPLKSSQKTKEEPHTVIEIFRNRGLFLKSCILYFNWFVNSFCYYGLTLNASEWSGDVHLSFAINGFMEIPAYTLAIFVLLKSGRKFPYAISMLCTGIILLSTIGLPKDTAWTWATATLVTLGKAFVTFSFGTVILYTAEIYPTVLRTTGLGLSSFMGRFGAMVSPWVVLLGVYDHKAPLITYGLAALTAGLLALFLPETHKKKIPDTIEESEKFKLGLFS